MPFPVKSCATVCCGCLILQSVPVWPQGVRYPYILSNMRNRLDIVNVMPVMDSDTVLNAFCRPFVPSASVGATLVLRAFWLTDVLPSVFSVLLLPARCVSCWLLVCR
jgi:hypothetical protein